MCLRQINKDRVEESSKQEPRIRLDAECFFSLFNLVYLTQIGPDLHHSVCAHIRL